MYILDSGLRRPGPHGQGDLRNAPRASVFLIWEVKKQDWVIPQGFSLPKLSSSESARSSIGRTGVIFSLYHLLFFSPYISKVNHLNFSSLVEGIDFTSMINLKES